MPPNATDELLHQATALLKPLDPPTAASQQQRVADILDLYRKLGGPPHLSHPRTRTVQDALLKACERLESEMHATTQPSNTTTTDHLADNPSGGGTLAAPTAAEANPDTAVAWETLRDTGVCFSDVVGARDAVQAIREAMVLPFRFPDLYARLHLRPWRSILLYGPPGTGKSMLARAAAHEIAAVFFSVSCADVTSKWVGGSEKLIKVLFADARARAPAVIFFDEVDSIARARRTDTNVADQRLTNQLLLEMDTVLEGTAVVSVLAATNLPWELDAAVLRRFAKQILVDTPSDAERVVLLRMLFAKHAVEFSAEALEEFALQTKGFSGSDLANLVHECAYAPLRQLLAATAFEVRGDGRVRVWGPSKNMDEEEEDGESDVVEASLEEVLEAHGEGMLEVPGLSREMVWAAIRARQASVAGEVQFKYRNYARGVL